MGRDRHQYYDALDGLRAICIIFTVIHHTPGNPGINGTVGVDIFFALSGYLITTLLLREGEETGRICLSCFYIRRFFRIAPLYFLAIALYLPGVLLSYRFNGNIKGIEDFNAALPWLISFNSEWRPDSAGNLFGHAWTLGIEEKFYILWPLAFWLIPRKLSPILLAAGAPLLLLLDPDMARGYVGIIFGVIAALMIQHEGRGKAFIQSTPTGLWLALMAAGYAIATATGNSYFNLLVSLPSALFIAAIVNKDMDFYKSTLSFPPMVKIGRLTYAIYLIHRLVGNTFEQLLPKFGWHPGFFTSFVLVYGACIPVAWILQVMIEHPFINLGRKISRRISGTEQNAAVVPAR